MVLPSRFRGVASFTRQSLLHGVVLSALAFGTAQATEPISLNSATSRRDDTVTLVERVKNSVVNIHSERTVTQAADDPFRPGLMQPQRVNGMGTGIVLDPRGYIVTNYHVIDDVQSLRVRLCDGTTCVARVIATDKESDLALVKIDPPKPLAMVPLGTAQDLMLAEKVIAIGNAFGYEHTVTVGTVSALKRDVTLNKEISYKSLIQTQTPINPGNSGGPLFNKLGEVVGVNVAIRAGAQNIAFAIPVDTMIAKAGDMLSGKKRAGQRLGLTFGDKFERPAEDGPVRRSLIIERVDVGSTGAEAGLKIGDVVEKIGELAVNHSVDFERGLLDRPTKVRLKLNRNGETLELDVATGNNAVTERATITPADAIWARTGLKLQPVGANYVTQVDKALRGGLWVAEVGTGTVAGKVGLQRGDIVLGFHLWESLTLDNVVFVLTHKDLATFSPLKIFYVREGKIRDVEVKLGE